MQSNPAPQPNRTALLSDVFIGDGYYNLCLRIGELTILQEKTGVGPFVLQSRLMTGQWLVGDVVETLRLALIGGGLDSRKAYDLVQNYVVEGHLAEYATPAMEAVQAALFGAPEDEAKLDMGEVDDSDDPFAIPPIQMENSDGENSMKQSAARGDQSAS